MVLGHPLAFSLLGCSQAIPSSLPGCSHIHSRCHCLAAAVTVFVVQQVSFFMNNLTVDNMPQKSKELGHVIIPKYIEWFANYLVVRRAAQVIWGSASLLHFGSWPLVQLIWHIGPLFLFLSSCLWSHSFRWHSLRLIYCLMSISMVGV